MRPLDPQEGHREPVRTPYRPARSVSGEAELQRLAAYHATGRAFAYPTGQAALLLGVSIRTVRLWCDAGRLDYIRTLGGHRRILSASIVAMMHRRGIELPDPTELAKETA